MRVSATLSPLVLSSPCMEGIRDVAQG